MTTLSNTSAAATAHAQLRPVSVAVLDTDCGHAGQALVGTPPVSVCKEKDLRMSWNQKPSVITPNTRSAAPALTHTCAAFEPASNLAAAEYAARAAHAAADAL